MPVDPTSPAPADRPYARPMLTPLGTLADLTRGTSSGAIDDGLGGTNAAGDEGSIV